MEPTTVQVSNSKSITRKIDSPIFVTGVPRSGTTLLQAMMASNSGLFSLPETDFFSILAEKGLEFRDTVGTAELDKIKSGLSIKKAIELPDSFFEDLLSDSHTLDAGGVFEAIVEEYRPRWDSERKLRVVEKTPRHYLSIQDILAAYADAKILYVVRNPVSVVSSIMRTPFGTSPYPLAYARLWNHSVRLVRGLSNTVQGQLLVIRYEDLTRRPESILKEICAFLDVSYEPQMAEDFSQQFENVAPIKADWTENVGRGRVLDRTRVWTSNLNQGEAWIIELFTRRNRRAYGYAPVSEPGFLAIWRAFFAMSGKAARHYSQRLLASHGEKQL